MRGRSTIDRWRRPVLPHPRSRGALALPPAGRASSRASGCCPVLLSPRARSIRTMPSPCCAAHSTRSPSLIPNDLVFDQRVRLQSLLMPDQVAGSGSRDHDVDHEAGHRLAAPWHVIIVLQLALERAHRLHAGHLVGAVANFIQRMEISRALAGAEHLQKLIVECADMWLT